MADRQWGAGACDEQAAGAATGAGEAVFAAPLNVVARSSPGPVVYADPESLGRALANLLSNAIRLAPTGSTVTVAGGSAKG